VVVSRLVAHLGGRGPGNCYCGAIDAGAVSILLVTRSFGKSS
jgi:hypothetical protein